MSLATVFALEQVSVIRENKECRNRKRQSNNMQWQSRVLVPPQGIDTITILLWKGFPGGSDGKESACNAGDLGSIPGLRREWLPNPIFLPGEAHGQRSLAGYSPWGRKESDTTEQLSAHTRVSWGQRNKGKRRTLSFSIQNLPGLCFQSTIQPPEHRLQVLS